MTLPGSTTDTPIEVGGDPGPERKRYIFRPTQEISAQELAVALSWIFGANQNMVVTLSEEELKGAPEEARRYLEESG